MLRLDTNKGEVLYYIAATEMVKNEMQITSKYFIIVAVFIFFSSVCKAEDNESYLKKNAVYAEVAGHSRSLFSANYERLFTKNKYLNLSTRLGIGYTPGTGERDSGTYRKPGITIPLVISVLVGKKKHFAQFGIGYTPSFGETFTGVKGTTPVVYQNYESAFVLSMGYRFIDIGGVTIQFFPIAIWTNNPSQKFGYLFGMCLGYSW